MSYGVERPALPVGTVLQDYEIVEILGVGGFGVTYLAQHRNLNMPVAIKEYSPRDFSHRDTNNFIRPYTQEVDLFRYGLDRFLNEARDLVRFRHPNIVKVNDYMQANGTAYIVMEYVQGQTLSSWLASQTGSPPERELVDIFLKVLDGLHEVHQLGLLHRDIKPDNIYLQENGVPLLLDFGAARNALGSRSHSLHVIIAEGYSPKEQYAAEGKQGPWTDIYAVGASLRRAISGRVPIGSTTRADALDNGEPDPLQPAAELFEGQYSRTLLQAIDWCLRLNARDRPRDVRAVQEKLAMDDATVSVGAIHNIGAGQGDDVDPWSVSREAPPTQSPNKRFNWMHGGIVGGIVAVLTASGYWWIEKGSAIVTEGDVSGETGKFQEMLDVTYANDDLLHKLGTVLPVEEKLALSDSVRGARRAHQSGDHELAIRELKSVGEKQQRYLLRNPRKFVVGSDSQAVKDSIDQCRDSLGADNCASGWFEIEKKRVVTIKPFEINNSEVSFEEYAKFVENTGYQSIAEQRGWSLQQTSDFEIRKLVGFSWRHPDGPGSQYSQYLLHPVVHIASVDAARYCQFKGERLPSRAEWEYASKVGGTSSYSAYYDRQTRSNGVDRVTLQSVEVGSRTIFDHNTALYGMTGNVWEWTDTPDMVGSPRRFLKGGSWNEASAVFMRHEALRPEFSKDSFIDVGFRCARSVAQWPQTVSAGKNRATS